MIQYFRDITEIEKVYSICPLNENQYRTYIREFIKSATQYKQYNLDIEFYETYEMYEKVINNFTKIKQLMQNPFLMKIVI